MSHYDLQISTHTNMFETGDNPPPYSPLANETLYLSSQTSNQIQPSHRTNRLPTYGEAISFLNNGRTHSQVHSALPRYPWNFSLPRPKFDNMTWPFASDIPGSNISKDFYIRLSMLHYEFQGLERTLRRFQWYSRSYRPLDAHDFHVRPRRGARRDSPWSKPLRLNGYCFDPVEESVMEVTAAFLLEDPWLGKPKVYLSRPVAVSFETVQAMQREGRRERIGLCVGVPKTLVLVDCLKNVRVNCEVELVPKRSRWAF